MKNLQAVFVVNLIEDWHVWKVIVFDIMRHRSYCKYLSPDLA